MLAARPLVAVSGVHDQARAARARCVDVDFRGRRAAAPTPEVLEAIAQARAIIIGPSNPIISIGPILAVPGLAEAIRAARRRSWRSARWSRGEVVKGPTEAFMRWAGSPLNSGGIAAAYEGLIDGLVADERTGALPVLETDVLMDDARRAPAAGRADARVRAGARPERASVTRR